MNLGTIYLDFSDPIVFSEFNNKAIAENPNLKPFENDKDKIAVTNDLGL